MIRHDYHIEMFLAICILESREREKKNTRTKMTNGTSIHTHTQCENISFLPIELQILFVQWKNLPTNEWGRCNKVKESDRDRDRAESSGKECGTREERTQSKCSDMNVFVGCGSDSNSYSLYYTIDVCPSRLSFRVRGRESQSVCLLFYLTCDGIENGGS